MAQEKIVRAYGIDFGTTNTHISNVSVGEKHPMVEDFRIFSDRGIPSVVLYDTQAQSLVAFGKTALEEWYSLSASERKHFSLHSGFKQSLGIDDLSRRETEDFFRALFSYLQQQHFFPQPMPDPQAEWIVGVPCWAFDNHRQRLEAILLSLTGKSPRFEQEPEGALYYHLVHRDITREEAGRGVLVIDFGGGTLDLAYMKDMKTLQVWGAPVLGGYLFDDLFYGMFLAQNPDARASIRAENLEGFLRSVFFKNLKEKYSSALAGGRFKPYRETVAFGPHVLGNFLLPEAAEFCERARHYVPTSSLQRELQQRDFSAGSAQRAVEPDALRNATETQPADLLHMIERTLVFGKEELGLTSDSISLILLTGGSSRWPFFQDMVGKNFPATRIFSSPDPESTVGRGLGMIYSARQFERKVKKELKATRGQLVKELLSTYQELFREHLEQWVSRVSPILETEIVAQICAFSQQGGKLRRLKEELERTLKRLQHELEPYQQAFEQAYAQSVEQVTRMRLQRWFDENRVHIRPQAGLDSSGFPRDMALGFSPGNTLYQRFSALISLVTATVSGTLLGGGGIALLLSGPLGWGVGFLLGLLATLGMLMGGKKKLTPLLDSISFAPWFLKVAGISPRSIQKMVHKQLASSFLEFQGERLADMEKKLPELAEKLQQLLDEQLEFIQFSDLVDHRWKREGEQR
ncbi:MAG TPA: hypothetical protein PLF96_07145 [Thermotogota bacterium]|nr:hypothetical protein [Thermotogota bacterium]